MSPIVNVRRERYGVFGIASTETRLGVWFVAWGRVGDTTGDSALQEAATGVWFEFGLTRDEAVAKLKAELDGVVV